MRNSRITYELHCQVWDDTIPGRYGKGGWKLEAVAYTKLSGERAWEYVAAKSADEARRVLEQHRVGTFVAAYGVRDAASYGQLVAEHGSEEEMWTALRNG